MKTKSKIVLLIFFLLLIACQRSDKKDEFKKVVATTLKDINSSTYANSHKEKTIDTLYLFLLKHKNDSTNRNFHFKIASEYYSIDKFNKFLTVVKTAYNLSIKDKDSTHIAKSLYFYGDYYEEKSQLDSAFIYYSQSEKIYKEIKDTLNYGRTKLYKAGILFDAGIFSESEIEATNALKLLTKYNNTRLIYECYNLIGLSLSGLNNCKESLEYFGLALKQLDILEKENYPIKKIIKSKIACFNNMGIAYEKLKEYPEAIRLYNKCLRTKNLYQNFPKSYAMILDNLCHSKIKMGDYHGVYEMLNKSLKVSYSIDSKPIMASSKNNLGRYFLYKKDTKDALINIKEALAISKKIKHSELTLESLKLLMENELWNKINYTTQYLRITDSLQKVERATKNKFARIAYETDLVEEKNHILSKQNTYIIGVASLISLFSFSLFVIFRLKSRNKELFFIKEQQDANEKIYQLLLNQQSETVKARNEERNRIAMELHDGIVNSVFTTRFNLIQLNSHQIDKKEQLVKELEIAENEIRRVSHDLSQNLLFEDKSFTEIITNLVESQQNQYNTKFDVSVDKFIDWSSVSSVDKIHIYRIIQEALQNSNKYSKAKRCYIMILKTANKITIRIWDNGIGFNPDKIKLGIGLKNIKERTKSLNGELKITSIKGKGTTIEVIF